MAVSIPAQTTPMQPFLIRGECYGAHGQIRTGVILYVCLFRRQGRYAGKPLILNGAKLHSPILGTSAILLRELRSLLELYRRGSCQFPLNNITANWRINDHADHDHAIAGHAFGADMRPEPFTYSSASAEGLKP